MARGDFGESFYFKKQVAELVGDRIEPTLMLALTTMALAPIMSFAFRLAASDPKPHACGVGWLVPASRQNRARRSRNGVAGRRGGTLSGRRPGSP